jgi:hypothetical protein
MKKLPGLIALTLMLATASSAFAERDYYTHGLACQPFWGASPQLSYGETGVGNWTNANAAVSCPGFGTSQTLATPGGGFWTVTQGRVLVADNNSTQPLSCNVWSTDGYGWMSYGPSKFSCSSYGGCNDLTTAYVGQDWLVFDINPYWWDAVLGYSCTLPPTGPFASWIEETMSITGQP